MKVIGLLIATFVILGSCPGQVELEPGSELWMEREMDRIVNAMEEPDIPDRLIDLVEFAGVAADEAGTHDFYPDIRGAIAALAEQGGGTLLFRHSEGPQAWIKQTEIFRVRGPIHLQSHIELRFEPGVKLFFEFAPEAYLPDGEPVLRRYEGITLYSFSPLIYAFNATDIKLSFTGGSGALPIIQGDGERWQKWSYQGDVRMKKAGRLPAYRWIRSGLNAKDVPIRERICADPDYHFLRPTLMEFFHCERVLVENLKLKESPFWMVHPVFTRHFTIRNVMFEGHVVNNDGVDVDSSSMVLIENVIFDNHDDNVVIKSGRDREGREGARVAGTPLADIGSPFVRAGRITAPTEDVVARECVFKGHYAFCIGSELSGGARRIFMVDSWGPMDVRMGVFLKGGRKRGGVIEDIYVNNLRFNQVKGDVVCLIPNYDGDTESAHPSVFRDIYIRNIHAEQAVKGIRIFGWEDRLIGPVTIEDLRVGAVADPAPNGHLLLNQVREIRLRDVVIEGRLYDRYVDERKEAGVAPPRQG